MILLKKMLAYCLTYVDNLSYSFGPGKAEDKLKGIKLMGTEKS